MDIEKVFPLALVAMFVFFIALESLRPARPLPRVGGWRRKGVVAFVMAGAVSATSPLLYIDFIDRHRIGNLEPLGTLGGALLSFVLLELGGYWVHRAFHAKPLWRLTHQLHHSAERVDIYGAAYFHPVEIAITGFIGSLVSTLLLGVSAHAAALAALFGIGLSMFQHTNVKTPRWLGYVIQRPESHSVHHQRGRHALNYSRLPFVDMLFGSFENPEYFEPEAGFYPGASGRVIEMLTGIDIASVPDRDRTRSVPAT
jgi:sterol desaturase/sphingolipid hydroxylase (fatty acid hydroxylase superfamily)